MNKKRNSLNKTINIRRMFKAIYAFAFALMILYIYSPNALAVYIQQYQGTNQYTTDSAGPKFVVVPLLDFPLPGNNVDATLQIGRDDLNPVVISNPNNAGMLQFTATDIEMNLTGTLMVNGQAVLFGNTDSANTPNTVALRDANGDFAAGVITANSFVGPLTGVVQTAAQPNITSVGTLTSLTVSGTTTVQGNLSATGAGANLDFGTNRLRNIADATANTDAVSKGQMDTAIATAVGSLYLATGQISMPPEADPANPIQREFDTTADVTFPVNALNGKTLQYAVSINTSPPFRFNLPSKSVNVGFQNDTGGDPSVALQQVPGTNGNILYGIENLGGGQYRIVLQRLANNQPGFDPVFSGQLTFELDFFGN